MSVLHYPLPNIIEVETIGLFTQRPGRSGTWDYENTDGLGILKYFQLRISLAQRQY